MGRKKERRCSLAHSLDLTAALPLEGEREHEDQLPQSIRWWRGGEKAGKPSCGLGNGKKELRERCVVPITAVRLGAAQLVSREHC